MTREEFIERHQEIIKQYNVCFDDDCDLWSAVRGFIYYDGKPDDDGKSMLQLSGLFYNEDGLIDGDFEGYIKILEEELFKIKGYEREETINTGDVEEDCR